MPFRDGVDDNESEPNTFFLRGTHWGHMLLQCSLSDLFPRVLANKLHTLWMNVEFDFNFSFGIIFKSFCSIFEDIEHRESEL